MNKKEKPQEESLTKITIVILLLFACFGTLIYGLYAVTTNIDLDSTITFNMDNNSLEAAKILERVQETQYNNDCEIKLIEQNKRFEIELINQSKKYDKIMFDTILHERGLNK